jgi:hypothetical protein
LPSVSKDTLGPFAFVLLFSFQGSCSGLVNHQNPAVLGRVEQAILTQPKWPVNVFLYCLSSLI